MATTGTRRTAGWALLLSVCIVASGAVSTAAADTPVGEAGASSPAPHGIGNEVGDTALVADVTLEGGFSPDPHSAELRAAGAVAAPDGCPGYVSGESADYRVEYYPSEFTISFFVEGDVDTVLCIELPSGEFVGNDDHEDGSGGAPGIRFGSPDPGVYAVWVGTYTQGAEGEAVLHVTEMGLFPNAADVTLEGGFSPDPHSAELRIAGAVAAPDGCRRYVSGESADYRVEYSPSDYPLGFYVESDVDTVLCIETPSGRFVYNDDHEDGSGEAPGIEFDTPESGVYAVRVGTFSEGVEASAVLHVTETGLFDGAPGGDPEESAGTGFFVSSSGHLLTNHHIVDDCSSITVGGPDSRESEAVTVALNRRYDIALLKTDDLPGTAAVFRDGPKLRIGEEIVVFGFPLRGSFSPGGVLTTGVVSATSGGPDSNNDEELHQIQISAETFPGSSGSPVMDRNGRIVGMIVSSIDGTSSDRSYTAGFAVRAPDLLTFLDVHRVDYESGDSDAGMSVTDIGDRARDFTATVTCHGGSGDRLDDDPGPDSCRFAHDGECDEPALCNPGTDTADCSRSGGPDSCVFAHDGECDEPNLCNPGTDTADCRGN